MNFLKSPNGPFKSLCGHDVDPKRAVWTSEGPMLTPYCVYLAAGDVSSIFYHYNVQV